VTVQLIIERIPRGLPAKLEIPTHAFNGKNKIKKKKKKERKKEKRWNTHHNGSQILTFKSTNCQLH